MSDSPDEKRPVRRDPGLPQFPAGSGDPVWEEPAPRPPRSAGWVGAGAVAGLALGVSGGGLWAFIDRPGDGLSTLVGGLCAGAVVGPMVGGFSGWLFMTWMAERAARRRHLDK